jgi:prolyl-tRNA synthetase
MKQNLQKIKFDISIFILGQDYSKKMELFSNKNENIYMGCYGIGVSRLVMALLEQQRDEFWFWG